MTLSKCFELQNSFRLIVQVVEKSKQFVGSVRYFCHNSVHLDILDIYIYSYILKLTAMGNKGQDQSMRGRSKVISPCLLLLLNALT